MKPRLSLSQNLKLGVRAVCKFKGILPLLFCVVLLGSAATAVHAQTIEISDPKVPADSPWPGALDLTFTVSSDVKHVRLLVTAKDDVSKTEIDIDSSKREQSVSTTLLKGLNKIELLAFKEGATDASARASMTLMCTGKKCGGSAPTTRDSGSGGAGGGPGSGGGTGQGGSKAASSVTIIQPSEPKVSDGFVNSLVAVKKGESNINTLLLIVTNSGKTVEQPKSRLAVTYKNDVAVLTPRIRVKSGENVITLLNLDNPIDKQGQASITVKCEGETCDRPTVSLDDIRITKPESGSPPLQNSAYVNSEIVVKKSSNILKVAVLVLNNGKKIVNPLDATSSADPNAISFAFDAADEKVLKPKIRIGPGKNTITIYDATKDLDDSPQDSTEVICEGDCGFQSLITIVSPVNDSKVDSSFVDSYISVAKDSPIHKIQYEVMNQGTTVFTSEVIDVPNNQAEAFPVRLKFLSGENTIRFFDSEDKTASDHQAFLKINCKGEHCASDFQVSKFASNSQNSRFVVGMEQAGASSANSETKPFLDMFFTAPLFFSRCAALPTNPAPTEDQKAAYRDCLAKKSPRLAAWGQVRLASTPDQIAAASVFPSNFVNQLGKSGTTVDLVQSFDFLAGLEVRLFSSNNSFLSLIPGVRQRTRFYVAAGGGAINPLNAKQELAQIFQIPAENSPQRADFVSRYGTPPASTPPKLYVGLVPLDRDRFLRQWYVGGRLKTMFCDNADCTLFKNSFPAIVDFMFGQNEAVTGGSLYYFVADPNDATKTIKKRSYVLRFDAFYPFPVREASFLYFYGSAVMKIGAGGVRVQNPLFLNTAPGDVLITDPSVYIPPSDLQMKFQPSRDYYKIGVGVNLTDLFNRNKTSQ